MPFVSVPGLKGQVYVPEQNQDINKKYPCPDCFSCQQCSEARCHVCRGEKNRKIIIQDKIGSKS